jgi:succinate-acetate transporter protein
MNKTISACAVGYAAFALALWFSSMVPAGWFDAASVPVAPWMAAILGGGALALAGALQAWRGHTPDAVLFITFAAYWWINLVESRLTSSGFASSPGFLGWYDLLWALLAFCLWLAVRRDCIARMLFTLGLCITLFVFALAHWLQLDALAILGGYLGLVTAIVGIYVAAAEVINATHGYTVLPLGENGAEHAPPRSP